MKLTYNIGKEKYEGNEYVSIISPETKSVVYEVPALKKQDIDTIYDYANEAFQEWKETTISYRAQILQTWATKLRNNKEKLADIMVEEIAKSKKDSLVEVERTAELIEYTIEQMYRLEHNYKTSEQYYGGNKNKYAITKFEPVGVVLGISPFNYPVNLLVSKIAPALMSGNTCVVKPATNGSAVGIEVVKLLQDSQLPEGVINIITGRGRDIGDYVVEHEGFNFISFTGGTTTGKNISQKIKMIPQVMELGGKDAAIILDDVDLETVASQLVNGAFSYSGQRCTAIKRIFVSENNKEKLENLLIKNINELTVGTADKNNAITAVINEQSADYISSLISDAQEKGAKILTGNKREENLIYPTLISNVTLDMRIAHEEQFGPILPVLTYKSIKEAITMTNDNEFGLQASIYGNDINDLFSIADKLDVGSVNFNAVSARGPDNFSFNGIKNSGIGVQGVEDSLKSMLRIKNIVINLK